MATNGIRMANGSIPGRQPVGDDHGIGAVKTRKIATAFITVLWCIARNAGLAKILINFFFDSS